MLAEAGFWICLGLLVYVYVGYPVLVSVLARAIGRDVRKADIEPKVSILIAAFNEEREIEKTIANKLSQDYPSKSLEIIVVSDGSTDRTDAIVRKLAKDSGGRVHFLRQEPRQGKTQALNLAMPRATGEVVVFADANSIYAPDAIRQLVRSFADPSVGYVTGQMLYTNPGGTGIGEGSRNYMRYEHSVRIQESRLGSVVGVDGGIDAVRRELYAPMHADQLPDFVLPLSVVEQGKRVVYEPKALVYEPALSAAGEEFRMRVRVSLRALWTLRDKRSLLNPLRRPVFAWQLLSHKALRYGAFAPLAGLFLFTALASAKHPGYLAFLVLQVAAYVLAGLGHLLSRPAAMASWRMRVYKKLRYGAVGKFLSRLPGLRAKMLVPYYFVILNVACAAAFWKFINREKMVLWKPRGGN